APSSASAWRSKALKNQEASFGAGSRDRTGILSLEGCCTTIVLYPRRRRAGVITPPVGAFPFGSSGRRVVEEVGLEPTKADASGFTVRPLCHSGHSSKRAPTTPNCSKPPCGGAEQKAHDHGCGLL